MPDFRFHLKTAAMALALAWVPGSGTVRAQHQTATLDEPFVDGVLPYAIQIQEVSFSSAEIPNIHSVAAATWEGQWVILAGRTNGLHGLTGNNAFDPAFENRDVWVIDPVAHASWHKSLEDSNASGLTRDEIDALSSVNTEFYQDGATLLVVGGYGFKRSAADHVTYDRISAIDLPGLVEWVKQPGGSETSRASDHIRQIADSYFQVTGGVLEKIGDEFQLVFGQNYPGRYRPHFNGIYTQCVRRFKVVGAGDTFSIPSTSKLQTAEDSAYRRRDLNVAKLLRYGSFSGMVEQAVVALSGVFTTSDGAWTVPVVIGADGNVQMLDPDAAQTLKQGFQVYHCAKTGLFHRGTGEMHIVLFGGITVLERDEISGEWLRDDNAPFTNQCSVVVHRADGKFEQYYLPTRYPAIHSDDGKELRFGANAEFFPNPEIPMLAHGVFDLAAIRQPTVLGHIFGGLVSDAGNGGNTGSSGRIFEVKLTPNLSPVLSLEIHATTEPWTLEMTAPAGISCLLESSADLHNWKPMLPPKATDNGPVTWSIEPATETSYYRTINGITSKP